MLPSTIVINAQKGVVVQQAANRIILGVAESDCHAVANQLIHLTLESSGYLVTNLGVCTPVSEFVSEAQKCNDTLAVVIGTMNGHAYQDLKPLKQFRDKLHSPVIVGGNLSVGAIKSGYETRRLRGLGVDYTLRSVDELLECLNLLQRSHISEHWPVPYPQQQNPATVR